MLDQLVWAIAHPDKGHPGVRADIGDRFFIAVLLIRHFKHHGGLVLPNLEAARIKEAAHEALITSHQTLGRPTENLMMHYPNWYDPSAVYLPTVMSDKTHRRDSLSVSRPPGLGGPTRALSVTTTLPSNFPAGRLVSDPASPGQPFQFGAFGDSCPRS